MWFIGLIAGGFLGSAIGGVGIFVGAGLGVIAGVLFSTYTAVPADKQRFDAIEETIRKLSARVKVLEAGTTVNEPSAEAPTNGVTVDALVQPVQSTMPLTVEMAVLSESAGALPVSSSDDVSPISRAQAEPEEPSAILDFFFGGNTLVRVGILVLFIGVSFLLKYAAEHGLVPIELRLAGVAAGGIVLLVLGWRLRTKREGYALMLQGGGIGILYLTVFAGLRLYQLLPPTLAFVLLAGIALFSALLAIAQDSKALAITGAVGGFLAPILASTGGGSHVALFSFYVVLNAGILFIAWFKAWRELNLVGFLFTALIGLIWGMDRYQSALFSTTEPFLVLFFVMYVAIAVLFALRQAPRLTHYVDGTIVFGVPLMAFGMQAAMLKGTEFGSAISALVVAAFYLSLASMLYAKKRESLRLLVESFLALGVGFATLAVPLALDARWTSAVWAVEGAAIVWVGARQSRLLARVFGMLLQIAAGVSFLSQFVRANQSDYLSPVVLNANYLGCVMVSVAALFINAYMARRRDITGDGERLAVDALFVWGALWWFCGGIAEIQRHLAAQMEWNVMLMFFSVSCAAFVFLWRQFDWRMARYAALALLPLMVCSVLGLAESAARHPFAYLGYVGWLAAFAVHLAVLRRQEPEHVGGWLEWWHAAGFWLFAIVFSWEVAWQIDRYVEGQRVWSLIAWAVVPAILIALFAARGERLVWPVQAHRYGYLYLGAMPVAVFLVVWIVAVNFVSDGGAAPLPYVPFVNPLDIAQFGALLAIAVWYSRLFLMELPDAQLPEMPVVLALLGGLLFIALNGVLLRTLHHYADVPFGFGRMMDSTLVQASLSLFWSLLALTTMFFANKRGWRTLWLVGAALLAVVIVKLVLVDLSNRGTVERIVSFIGVGLFCVVIGYFAPVPPKAAVREGE